ncbi:RyR domain-containing protein [Thiohalocapsa sp. ML1]|jgi:hypothetical protein|uniref:RyR domain-containing protein n=1 Tax=Thiohalocapsa sp. ML1 TaxID=1431688 RepID=UPI000731FFBA|nr:RyR domain-containing protein [Thiohalocapsa sp. ML1]
MGASASAVLVVGDAPLLTQAAAALVAQGVAVRRVRDAAGARLPRRTALLLLARGTGLGRELDWARHASRGRSRPLRTVVLGGAPEATAAEDAAEQGAGLRLEWLNPEATAARALLARWPLHRAFDPPYGQDPHLVVAGFGPFARALLLHALRIGQYADHAPVVTLAADDPGAWRDWLEAEHPQAGVCGRLRFASLPAPDLADAAPVTTIVVCDLPPAPALACARGLRDAAAEQGASPLVLLAADADWPQAARGDWDGQLVPVRPLALAFSREGLLFGRDDVLAEVIHEHYRDTSAAQGRDPAAAPSGRPWPELPASYRNANRHQADHLWAKLAVTDCRAVPEEQVESFAFAPTEVERLAIIEHRRWAVERWLDGWTFAPVRDNARKLHPQLIPYAELSDAMQDLDRFAVRLVPSLLARSGLGVVRRLLVAVRGDGEAAAPGVPRRALAELLRRLLERYPDRGLTLVLDPSDALARRLAEEALRETDAGLFLLLPAALPRLLAGAQPEARTAILRLLEAAERRIPLAGDAAAADWIARRAEILCVLGDGAPMAGTPPAKRVQLDRQGRARWRFDY